MSQGNPVSGQPTDGRSQFSKFSVNEERPTKRRRDANADLRPNVPASISTPGASDVAIQVDKAAGKSIDGPASAPPRSCAECRRMKLKCDRVFPCKTCRRRGLEGICPEGSLVTGRGTRYVLASTEELHEKILQMADRIKTLEDALAILYHERGNCRQCSCESNLKQNNLTEPHPLLRSDLLLIKGQLELYGLHPRKEQDTSGQHMETSSPLQVSSEGTKKQAKSPKEDAPHPTADREETDPSTPETKLERSIAGGCDSSERTNRAAADGKRKRFDGETPQERGKRLRAILPSREEAEYLAREAIFNGAWILNITSRPADRAKLLDKVYDGSVEFIRPQEIALSLMAFTIGKRVNIGPASSGNIVRFTSRDNLCSPHTFDAHRVRISDKSCEDFKIKDNEQDTHTSAAKASNIRSSGREAHEFYCLAKACINEPSVRLEPDQNVVHCLYLMTWYLSALTDVREAGREAMVVLDLALKTAFKIGMHLEETYVGLSAEVEQERRILFWALLHVESRLRLDMGCRGALGTMRITAKRPVTSVPNAIKSFPTHSQALYHDSKLAFLEECIVPVLEMISQTPDFRLQEHNYYEVLALDRRIRDFKLPPVLAEPISAPPPPDSCESFPADSPANLNYILNPTTSPSSFNLFYSGGKAPRNVLRMIRAKAQQERFLTLLHLHRAFFYAHIRDQRPLVQRMFLPSAIACFSAACGIIRTVKDAYAVEPVLAARVSVFWYNAFNASTLLFMLIAYKPFCPVSALALQEIDNAKNLFLTASAKCHMAARSYPFLKEFHTKASDIFDRWQKESEGDMGVFGPNGEIMLCQTRIDVVIERLQSVPVPSPAEEDATTGLLNLKGPSAKSTLAGMEGGSGEQSVASQWGCETDEEGCQLFYDMWQHVHREITDFVRRIPEVLKDALVDPRRATAARLIWGFIPLLDESKIEGPTPIEEPRSTVQLPSDFDWSKFTYALIHPPGVDVDNATTVHLGLPSPPSTTYSPAGSQSSFTLLDMWTGMDSVGSTANSCQGDAPENTSNVTTDNSLP